MKTNLLTSVLALCAVCTAAHLSAVESSSVSTRALGETPIQQVAAKVQANGSTVEAGTSRVMVSMRLGSPNAVLADGTWLYYGYSARLAPSGPSPRGTLVVRFINSKVTSLSLADKSTVTALRQEPRQPAASELLAVR